MEIYALKSLSIFFHRSIFSVICIYKCYFFWSMIPPIFDILNFKNFQQKGLCNVMMSTHADYKSLSHLWKTPLVFFPHSSLSLFPYLSTWMFTVRASLANSTVKIPTTSCLRHVSGFKRRMTNAFLISKVLHVTDFK